MITTTLSKNARTQMWVRALLAPALLIALIFLAAGRWDYWQAWVYIFLNFVIVVLIGTVFTKDSQLIEERLSPKEGTKVWDKIYFGITVPLYFLAIILGGLDARFGWTINSMPSIVYWGSVVVYIIGQSIFLWARYTNSYFSSVVRIQSDRGQTVCKDGPYRYVRHPGYVGGFLFTLMSGLMLGSWWAFVPQAIAALLIIWRTSLEDKTLQAELPGYSEYTKETHYRLIPGVW